MKIIMKSNFDNDRVSDELVCENVSMAYAKEIRDFLQKKYCSEYSTYYCEVVDDGYKLYRFQP